MLYFSDCQAGAAAGCVPGSNSNPGTQASPKQNLSGVNIAALPAGSQLLFKRGGSFSISNLSVENNNSSASAPIVFDAWGSGAVPVWRVASGVGVSLGGGWGNTNNDGGYTFRNLRVQGLNGNSSEGNHWGFWLVQNVRDVTIENVEITGFKIAIHASTGSPYGVSGLHVRNSIISRNADMGHLGALQNSSYEGNLFEANNFSGSMMNHAIYLGGGNNNVIRNNRFVRNSAVNGQCTGGNVTVHGMVDGLLIEGNTVTQDAGASSCAGFSVTQGYDYTEAFRNVTVRGNTTVNTGTCSICINSAPGAVIENNRAVVTSGSQTLAFTYGQNDTPMTSPTVRNNTLCTVSGGGSISNLAGALLSGNATYTGSAATSGACSL